MMCCPASVCAPLDLTDIPLLSSTYVGQLPQTFSNAPLANGLAFLVFVSLQARRTLGIESEVLLTADQVFQKFNGNETDRNTRKPQRSPESC